MKKLLILLISMFIQVLVFPQSGGTITVSKDIKLIKLSDNAYIHVSYADVKGYGRIGANGLIIVNKGKAIMLDTPWNDSLTANLYSWIKDTMKLKLVAVIPNHFHADCMGGLRFLQQKRVKSYANRMTRNIAKWKRLPVPEIGFADSMQIKLGNILIRCYFLGAAHTKDNIVVWIPSEQILFPGCIVKSMDAKDLGNTADGDLQAYPKTIDNILQKFPTAKIVVPGHGDCGGVELLVHTKELATEKH
ncbi:MAG: subclass B1 metallo-beta-lactamase [Paludibacteraceae bacterium]|nr:subclass B1 metallo-beta-lactamase [Paludibacteraceae bacterium]